MKNPFKTKGFDSIISAGTKIEATKYALPSGTTTVVDGEIVGGEILGSADSDTTLIVNGLVNVENIELPNLTIHGHVEVNLIRVNGVLAVKKGAKLVAQHILYDTLVIETGAHVHGQFMKLGQPAAEPIEDQRT